jgi:hypothetical protein
MEKMPIRSYILTKKEPENAEGFDRRLEGCFACEKPRFSKDGKVLWKSEHILFTNSPYSIRLTICRECRERVTFGQVMKKVYKHVGTTHLTEIYSE